MRYYIAFVLVFLFNNTSFAQGNLVPNGDAENFTSCPSSFGQVNVTGWFSTRETPDYLNSCASLPGPAVPYNYAYGFQEPFSGNGYFGAGTYFNASATDLREYFGCQLLSPLIVGAKYYLTFRTNCAFGGGGGFNLSVGKLGARLTVNSYSQTNPIPVDNYCQFLFDTLITDTLNWTLLRGSFVADSVYEYISLGNFYDDAHTNVLAIGTVGTKSGYFFDNICLSTDSLFCEQFVTALPKEKNDIPFFEIVNKGGGDFEIKTKENGKYILNISNTSGQNIYEKKSNDSVSFKLPQFYSNQLLLFRLINIETGINQTQKIFFFY